MARLAEIVPEQSNSAFVRAIWPWQMNDRARESLVGRTDLLVQSVTDYAIYMLDTQGNVVSWNAGAERFMGYTEAEIIGQHFSSFYAEEDAGQGVPARALETALEQGCFEAEGWRVRKDGSQLWASVVINPIRDSDGQFIGFAKITRDLSERHEAQLALQKSQDASFQSQKLEAIGKLTGGVAHDFNNLLAAILSSLDLAERRLSAGQDAHQFLGNARQAAERGALLTQRMLAFARKQELQIEPVDVPVAVGGITELLARTIGSEIRIDTRFPLALPAVHADLQQLELAIVNLVVNAKDAMPDGGRIEIAARESTWPDSDAKFVCLSVTDEGEGMDEATLAQATDPFFTTKDVGRGTGLGLSMVQGMVEQCGGRFRLTSTPGQGTTAELWLAISEQPPSRGSVTQNSEPLPIFQSRNILVVDDDPMICVTTAMLLEELGHTVKRATSGAEALRLLTDRDIDLLLTDYAMPGMTGAELVKEAQSRNPGLEAIIVSGYADLPNGVTITTPRLAKPYSEIELSKAIAALRHAPNGDASAE